MIENLEWFEKNRKEQSDCVKQYQESPRVVIKAPVKSGKRQLCEIEALRTKRPGLEGYQHYFLCSLNRKDNKVQYQEMKAYGIKCYTYLDYEKFIDEINSGLNNNENRYYIFVDESDLGTEEKQKLAEVFEELVELSISRKEFEKRIFLRFYSATQHEIEYSNYIEFCEKIKFIPAECYRGAEYFLDNNLVREAEPFFIFNKDKEIILSQQAIELLKGFSESKDKIFSILRITGTGNHPGFADVMNDERIQNYLGEKYKIILKKVDEKHPMAWGDIDALNDGQFTWKDQYQRSLSAFDGKGGKTIFVINQTCTRSTEVGFIPLIYFWHESRSDKTPYNTIVQSSMRCCHYPYKKMVREINEGKERCYWGDDPDTKVQIYTNVDCIKLYAERIDVKEYQEKQPKRPISTRVTSGVGDFMPTPEMNKKRRIQVLDIPEDILSAAFDSPSAKKNQKSKYPSINAWALDQKVVKEHYERYQVVAGDKSNFFIRPVSANNTNNIAKALLDKSSHCILAPILFDAPNKNYVDDYNKVLSKYPDWEKKLIIVHISDIEYNERIKHRKNPSPKVKGSVYEIDQDKLNKSFDLSDKLLAVPEIKP